MKKKFIDPYIEKKSKKSNELFQCFPKTSIPLPSEVEISESGTCNRKCSFCPRSAPDFKDVKEFINDQLILKLVNELKNYYYKGTIRFSGFVEPLLDKNIFKLINICRINLPESNIEMVTNGDVLNLSRLKKLFENGLSKLLISVYDGPEDVTKFENLCNDAGLRKNEFFIRHRYLPPEEDFGITLSNRAGMMENAEFQIKKLENTLKKPCYYPSYTFFLDYNGDVLMCPHDWGKKRILGNLKNNSFKEIWLSKLSIESRSKLNGSNRNFSPCSDCDVSGTLIGKKHANAWNNYKEIK
ncbi:radical SAM/SPASM domain-containing protein [Candidatus Pelagibacter communis]|uniref:radical SAM/SPASM domain-containing protein n=1 Tax=Pelagibacter ubique TaxID=198252 RepID=UPI00094C113D|nr:radical SAM/SPASM domain-containing protein [Candidatus Pelagibacter ubique]